MELKESMSSYEKRYNSYKEYYNKLVVNDYPLEKKLSFDEFIHTSDETKALTGRTPSYKSIANQQIDYKHTKKYAKAVKKAIRKASKQNGEIEVSSLEDIMKEGVDNKVWKVISNERKRLKEEGKSSSEVSHIISQTFFGSD